jgi:hypothetical protein
MASRSVGKFFNAEIRDKFPYHKLEDDNARTQAEAHKASQPLEDESTPRTDHPDSGFSEV